MTNFGGVKLLNKKKLQILVFTMLTVALLLSACAPAQPKESGEAWW